MTFRSGDAEQQLLGDLYPSNGHFNGVVEEVITVGNSTSVQAMHEGKARVNAVYTGLRGFSRWKKGRDLAADVCEI